ncbi:hypothetical protein M0802_010919 [Mischocyttarus mexicanus]|nr:hypothetical protein M0802_010919 [Mischocyttarus mexicanus]
MQVEVKEEEKEEVGDLSNYDRREELRELEEEVKEKEFEVEVVEEVEVEVEEVEEKEEDCVRGEGETNNTELVHLP